MVQTQTASKLYAYAASQFAAPLVLYIEGLGVVVGIAALHTHRSLQLVATPLKAGTQPIVEWQGKNAFQVSHRATLVALQLYIVGEIGIVGRIIAFGVVAVAQRDSGIIIGIGVTVPVDIKGQLTLLAHLPLAACGKTLVEVLHVVGLHIDSGILSTGPVDAFPVGRALGIELQSLHRLVG